MITRCSAGAARCWCLTGNHERGRFSAAREGNTVHDGFHGWQSCHLQLHAGKVRGAEGKGVEAMPGVLQAMVHVLGGHRGVVLTLPLQQGQRRHSVSQLYVLSLPACVAARDKAAAKLWARVLAYPWCWWWPVCFDHAPVSLCTQAPTCKTSGMPDNVTVTLRVLSCIPPSPVTEFARRHLLDLRST